MGRKSPYPTHMIEVGNMGERKQLLKSEADLFVVFPGGYGTLDEMFDVIASGTVGEHKKPLVCINEDGFYHFLLKQIEIMNEECFTPKNELYAPIFVNSTDECWDVIEKLKLK